MAEGGFNRVFEILMKDSTTIIARLPYPSTFPRRLAVASEAATIDFIRAHGIPTPKILAYATGEKSVGSECILMEKLSGQPIGDACEPWEGLSTTLQYDLVKVEKKWAEIVSPKQDGTAPECPITLTQQEADDIHALEESHRDADGDVENINGFLGVASDGWTTNENFETAKSKAAYIRERALTSADDDPWLREMSERHWPFDDYDEAE
ncbi:hypothetical protein E8E13_000796 [Curvularia kusanoi]|uniref:Aminoglycoside phosphotransferase domain-containing protein n=1 Tax=Curvularia kusanoi TaxID=90978 RepID=A0A9P4TBB9_CURKU|nr:hypothetical protein E8E13_000796 [Curvularia kusanoi]